MNNILGKNIKLEFHYRGKGSRNFVVVDLILDNELYTAVTECKNGDNYSKIVGRKKALANLFRKFPNKFGGKNNYELRQAVWDELWRSGCRSSFDHDRSVRRKLRAMICHEINTAVAYPNNEDDNDVLSRAMRGLMKRLGISSV